MHTAIFTAEPPDECGPNPDSRGKVAAGRTPFNPFRTAVGDPAVGDATVGETTVGDPTVL
jgi:hypothetical protein